MKKYSQQMILVIFLFIVGLISQPPQLVSATTSTQDPDISSQPLVTSSPINTQDAEIAERSSEDILNDFSEQNDDNNNNPPSFISCDDFVIRDLMRCGIDVSCAERGTGVIKSTRQMYDEMQSPNFSWGDDFTTFGGVRFGTQDACEEFCDGSADGCLMTLDMAQMRGLGNSDYNNGFSQVMSNADSCEENTCPSDNLDDATDSQIDAPPPVS